MSLGKLLIALSDGEFHSGDQLGDDLGVSRTAIWKQLKKVEELGLDVESIKGKGYRIPGGLDLLDRQYVLSTIEASTAGLLSELEVSPVVDSTNVLAMQKAVNGGSGYVCTAEQQTGGKGRRGREWVSPYAENIYLSIVWEFSGGAASLEGLSLAVGVAVVEALRAGGVSGAQLKWPNDVLFKGKKLAGVLLEMVGDAAGPCRVVVGIGLNVHMNDVAAGVIDQPWTSVNEVSDEKLTRNTILTLLLDRVMPMLNSFESGGFARYRDDWMALDAFANKDVVVRLGDQVVPGVARGVDDTGALVLETLAGNRIFNGGEVSLRIA